MSEAVRASVPGQGRFILGDSLLFSSLVHIVWGNLPPGQDIMLHPVAFAGWLGLFVTSLNLLPIGQLDGGHVVFALWGGRQRSISALVVLAAIGLGLLRVVAPIPWLVFCGIAVAVTGIAHPPVYDPHVALDVRRRATGCLALIVFLLCFAPVPFGVVLP
jgi:membrane-associated protease RseP (regulator of RpoE activity)